MQPRGGPGPGETRNVIIAVLLSGAILFGFEFFYNAPMRRELEAEQRARIEQQAQTPLPGAESGETPAPQTPAAPLTRDQVLAAEGARIEIDTPSVDGSIALQGARIDDLNLRGYRRTIEENSPEVTLLSPVGAEFGHDAFFGWELQRGGDVSTLADADSAWSAQEGARLTPETPVTLTLATDSGLTIERRIEIDQDYMFTIIDTVRNPTGQPVETRPLGVVRRQGLPENYRNLPIVHQGLIGAFGPNNSLHQVGFNRAEKHANNRTRGRVGADERIEDLQGQGGWFGITEHYWLTAIVPDQGERVSTFFDSRDVNNDTDYRAAYRGEWHAVPAGGEVTYTQRLFAGAKRFEELEAYQDNLNIPRFDDAIDWGNFWFLTRPYFLWLLHPLAKWAGNFAIAILLTTIVIKLAMFPLVYQSYRSMARMRAIQPKMKEVQERYAADKQRQQQEIMRLFQTEKVNPVAGCVPMLFTIPVFYALYKTLSVTIEMRHTPFWGWIEDMSARDPTSLFNLFGLLPYDVPTFLMIGAWPIMYGVSMMALQALSPPPTDPTQAQIFRFLPILFTVMFASFPAGLVIYWTWSNILTILQQYIIMRSQGVDTQLDVFIRKRFGKEATPAE